MPTEGPTPGHTEALDRLVSLIKGAGLSDPNVCEYGATEVRIFWTDRKVAVVIDLEDLEPVTARRAATTQYAERTWTYVGCRQLRSGGLGYLRLNQAGEEAFFKQVRGAVIGGTYTVTANDEESLVKGTPIFQPGDRHPQAAGWDLEDRAAYNVDQARLVEARAAKAIPFEDLTLRELRAQLVAAPATARTAMLAVILRKLNA